MVKCRYVGDKKPQFFLVSVNEYESELLLLLNTMISLYGVHSVSTPHAKAFGSVFAAALVQFSGLYPTISPLAEYPCTPLYTPANAPPGEYNVTVPFLNTGSVKV